MRKIESIISACGRAAVSDLQCTLATIVHVEGSSYRKARARMLVDENDLMTGAISGGCPGSDALRKVLHAIYRNQKKLIYYDTSDENDAVAGAQPGYNGVIRVLFEPIDPKDRHNPVVLLQEVVRYEEQKGTQLIFDQNLSASQQLSDEELFAQIKRDASKVLECQFPHFREHIKNGAKKVLLNAREDIHLINFPEGEFDIDTPVDMDRLAE